MRTSFHSTFIVLFSASFLTFSGCSAVSHEGHEGHDHGAIKMDTQTSETKQQTVCPVLGNEINKEFYIDHMGKRIYFCCQTCLDTFKEDPEKYMKKL